MAEKPSNSKSNNVKNFVEKSARTVTENAKKAGTAAKNGAKTAASTVKNASSAVLENAKDTINTQIPLSRFRNYWELATTKHLTEYPA